MYYSDLIYQYPIDYKIVLSIQKGFLEAISNQVSETVLLRRPFFARAMYS